MARERKFTKKELYQLTKDTLVEVGYKGFTFSILAEQLNVSRGTIYKYFENKDELITEYMVYELNQFLGELKLIQEYQSFEEQFDYLLHIIFKDKKIHQIIRMGSEIQHSENERVQKNQQELSKLHLDMYTHLEDFIQLGKGEKLIKPSLHSGLILGFIFQTVAIPNHFHIPDEEWLASIKEMLRDGMLLHN